MSNMKILNHKGHSVIVKKTNKQQKCYLYSIIDTGYYITSNMDDLILFWSNATTLKIKN